MREDMVERKARQDEQKAADLIRAQEALRGRRWVGAARLLDGEEPSSLRSEEHTSELQSP